MTDHQTLEWLLAKLRDAESLHAYYVKRIAELEAKPSEATPSQWMPASSTPPPGRPLVGYLVDDSDPFARCFRIVTWSSLPQRFLVAPLGDPTDLVVAWMPIPECDK